MDRNDSGMLEVFDNDFVVDGDIEFVGFVGFVGFVDFVGFVGFVDFVDLDL
jgi:hypothetical protein